MRLSIKQKQVLGVTFMVAIIVIALSVLHLGNTAGVLLAESRDRFELFGSSVYSQAAAAIMAPETAYNDVRTSKYVQSALQSALYSQDTVDAAIVDPQGVVIASSDPELVGKKATFKVTVKKVEEQVVPELTDELAKEVSGLDSVDALKADLADKIRARLERAARSRQQDAIVGKLLEANPFEA